MGEANLKGSKEERIKQGIAKRLERERLMQKVFEDKAKAEKELLDKMTPEQRSAYHRRMALYLSLLEATTSSLPRFKKF